jgi:hypothetical protein
MSWKRNSNRNFKVESGATPEKVGPGTYESDQFPQSVCSPSACFRSRDARDFAFTVHSFNTPAPGAYDQGSQSSRLAKTSPFRTDARRDVFAAQTSNPGPAAYSTMRDWSPKATPRGPHVPSRTRAVSGNVGQAIGYEISTTGEIRPVKQIVHGSDWVGPGSYSADAAGSGRVHSLDDSYRDCLRATDHQVPGPGAYTVSLPTSRYPTRIKRKTARDRIDPPQGCERPHDCWAPKTKRADSSMFKSKSERQIFSEPHDGPPPTAYQRGHGREVTPSRTAFGHGSPRFEKARRDATPGPGDYEAKPAAWAKSLTTGGNRAVDKWDTGDDVPGPGSYDPDRDGLNEVRPTSAFASGTRRGSQVQAGPGPGSYNVAPRTGGGKQAIHAGRLPHFADFMHDPFHDNPAPDAYQEIPDAAGRGRTIPRTPRFGGGKDEGLPGPGTYGIGHRSFVKKSYNVDFLHKL